MRGELMDAQVLPPVDPRSLATRLRQAREDKGLTQDQVAQHLGIARTTVVAIEKGDRRVKAEELIELASLYGRRLSALLQGGQPVEGFSVQLRGACVPTPAEADLLQCIEEFQALCEDYLQLETMRRAPLGKRYPPQYEVEEVDPGQAAEDVAVEERRRLGLGDGPLLNLREVLEGGVGLRIFVFKLPSRVAGLYAFTDELGGCVALNLEHPPERRRQSLAHEYGHFLTSRFRSEVLQEGRYERRPHLELFAEAFGRAFLMPMEGLRRQFLNVKRERKGTVTRGDLCRLAYSFDVSVEAMVRRLEEIQLVPSGLWDRLRLEGFKVREAMRLLGLETSLRHDQMLPVRFVTLALESWQEGDLTEGQFARFMRVSRLKAREIVQIATTSGEEQEVTLDLSAPIVS
jgi:Zn-dependent peptidase ImmA (M78 family)/transcriptional regulator with XRE-family HTH domain